MDRFNYLIQCNLYLVLFYVFYWLLLRKETFNQYNRLYLVLSGLAALLIPLWNLEIIQAWFITSKTTQLLQSLSLGTVTLRNEGAAPVFDWQQALQIVYAVGCALAGAKLIWNIWSLYHYMEHADKPTKAFTFLGNIVVSEHVAADDIIYKHEQVHAEQYHSFDILFFEIMGIFFWFNPVIYAYKAAIKNVHEFIADELASTMLGSKYQYAQLLFSEQFQTHPSVLVSNFFSKATLKQRIIMLNKEKSKKVAVLKYGLTAPLFVAMLVFTAANVSAAKIRAVIHAATHPNKTISGSILNAENEAIIGANIVVKNSTKGTTSDMEGKFTLSIPELPNEKISLVVSHVNYYSKELKIGDVKELEVHMTKNVHELIPGVVVTAMSAALKEKLRKDTTYRTKDDGPEIFTVVEKNAEFPGGVQALGKYLAKNLQYPKMAQGANVSGKVFLQFVVSTSGSISDIKVLKGLGFGLDEESVRVVATMPKWLPAEQQGKAVNSQFTMPISFVLEGPQAEDKHIVVSDQKGIKMVTPEMEKALIIVDGKELSNIDQLNPDTIESMNVLKGDKAREKYGEKGANGVIEITLKKK